MHAGLIREVSPISALLRRVSLIGGCAILLLTGNAFGQTGASGCATGTVLVHANGMFTNECDAWGNLMALQEQVVAQGIDGQLERDPANVAYDLAYNHNEAWYTQLAQVYEQKVRKRAGRNAH